MLYCRLSGKQESLSLPKYNLNIYMRSTVAAAAVQRKVQGVVSREVIRGGNAAPVPAAFPHSDARKCCTDGWRPDEDFPAAEIDGVM